MHTQWMISIWPLIIDIIICGGIWMLLLLDDKLSTFNKPKPKSKSKEKIIFKRGDNYPFD